VDFFPNQPQAQLQATDDDTSRAAGVSAESGGVARQSESQQPGGASGTVSNLLPSADAAQPTGLFPGPWYYAARYLHRRPTPLKPIRPAYPPETENLSGQVVLLLLINERGTVDTAHIIESQPPGRFDDLVIKAFAHETYAPGLITGYPVKSQLLVEVIFEPGALPETSILPDLTQYKIKAGPIPSAKEN
jgi:protein TonB